MVCFPLMPLKTYAASPATAAGLLHTGGGTDPFCGCGRGSNDNDENNTWKDMLALALYIYNSQPGL
jgi:hypothetical protein